MVTPSILNMDYVYKGVSFTMPLPFTISQFNAFCTIAVSALEFMTVENSEVTAAY